MRLFVAVVAALLLAGCAASSNPTTSWRPDQQNWPPAQPQPIGPSDAPPLPTFSPTPQTRVAWEDYRPGLQRDVDRAGEAKDCPALDRLFNEAASTDTADRLALTYISRWGQHRNCPVT